MAQSLALLKNQRVKRKKSRQHGETSGHGSIIDLAKIKSWLRWIGVSAVLGGIAVAGVGVARYEGFKLQKAVICIDGNCSPDQRRGAAYGLQELLAAYQGSNIYLLPTDEWEEQLAAYPGVEEVEIDADYPKAVKISITEKTAAILATENRHLVLVNAQGEIVRRATPKDQRDLPLATGCAEDQQKACLREAVAAMSSFRRLGVLPSVAEIGVEPEGYKVLLTGLAFPVLFDKSISEESLEKLEAVKPYLGKIGTITSLDLRFRGRAIARLAK